MEQIHEAIRSGDIARTQHLSATYDIKNLYSALDTAVECQQDDILEYLLSLGFAEDSLPIRAAIDTERTTVFEILLANGWDINAPFQNGIPALGYVLKNQQIVSWFLEKGADPNRQGQEALTPLSWAVRSADLEVVKLLISHGGDIRYGETLFYAAMRKSEAKDRDATTEAFEILDYLLGKGLHINRRRFEDNTNLSRQWSPFGLGTILHFAVEQRDKDLITYLLEKGADAFSRNTLGKTPAGIALESEDETLIRLFADRG